MHKQFMGKEYSFLEKYILENGYADLDNDAYSIYHAMVEAGIADEQARLVMVTLMSGVYKLAISGKSVDELTVMIQKEHFLIKRVAGQIAELYVQLFDPENIKEWERSSGQGFDDFCDSVWEMDWRGSCEWHAKGHMVLTCTAELHLEYEVADKEKLRKHLEKKLKNPFISADDVYRILEKEFSDILDQDLDDYCNGDDYYEPFMEEFPSEGTYEFGKACKEWGIEIIDLSGGGEVEY